MAIARSAGHSRRDREQRFAVGSGVVPAAVSLAWNATTALSARTVTPAGQRRRPPCRLRNRIGRVSPRDPFRVSNLALPRGRLQREPNRRSAQHARQTSGSEAAPHAADRAGVVTHKAVCSPAFRRFRSCTRRGRPPEGGTTNGLASNSWFGSRSVNR